MDQIILKANWKILKRGKIHTWIYVENTEGSFKIDTWKYVENTEGSFRTHAWIYVENTEG